MMYCETKKEAMQESKRETNGNKKWHGTQLTASEVLVYRGTISEPTPWGVSIVLIFSFL
jgi:hypothetical protein